MLNMYFIPFAIFAVLDAQAQTLPAECVQRQSVRPEECCPAVGIESGAECDIRKDSDPSLGEGGGPPCEAFECLFKKNNLLTADSKVNRSDLKASMQRQYSEEWKPAIERAFAECVAEADTAGYDCESRLIFHCFKRQMLINCPTTVWVSSAECEEVKSVAQRCAPPARS